MLTAAARLRGIAAVAAKVAAAKVAAVAAAKVAAAATAPAKAAAGSARVGAVAVPGLAVAASYDGDGCEAAGAPDLEVEAAAALRALDWRLPAEISAAQGAGAQARRGHLPRPARTQAHRAASVAPHREAWVGGSGWSARVAGADGRASRSTLSHTVEHKWKCESARAHTHCAPTKGLLGATRGYENVAMGGGPIRH